MKDYKTIFEALTADPRYRDNLDWGEPRSGHPEGTVRAHIAELERNLRTLRDGLSEDEIWKLRLLIHVHDTFKAEAKRGAPITHPRSHASLARAFFAEFCDDADLAAMIQYHDEPYALFRQLESKGRFSRERWTYLLSAIQDWNLFIAFLIIDGCTQGKGREPLYWLLEQVRGKVETRFGVEDILVGQAF